jgi:hypothetical protein
MARTVAMMDSETEVRAHIAREKKQAETIWKLRLIVNILVTLCVTMALILSAVVLAIKWGG